MRAALVALAAASFTAGPPARAGDPGAYPPDRYLVAEAESEEGRAAAEAAARAGVAAQISARIDATLEVETRSEGGQEGQKIRAHVRSRSTFAHGELIEVPPDLVRCAGRRCVATAVLDRQRADAILAEAYGEPAGRLRRAAEAAERAPSIVGYTRHLREADRAWADLRPLASQRQVIAGAAPADVAADRAQRAALVAGRDRRLTALRLAVLPGSLPADAVGTAARDALVGALTRAGLAAQRADACVDGLAIVPAGEITCDTGSFGPRCALPLTAEVQPCPGGPPLATLDLRGAKLTGVSPHTEADARARLAARITADRLAEVVPDAVHPILPLP